MKNSILFALAVLAFSASTSGQITVAPLAFSSCDSSANDPQLWHGAPFFSQPCADDDLPEAAKKVGIQVSSGCPTAVFSASFELFLDLNGDGTPETTVNSASPTLRFSLVDSTGAGGERFFLLARDPENDAAFPGAADRFFSTVHLPYGSHEIRWAVADGCGATALPTVPIEVRDCKKPTLVCKPLAGPIMNSFGSLTVYATDWVEQASDNACLAPGWFAVRKKDDAGFGSGLPPLTASGGPVISVVFHCGQNYWNMLTLPIEIWTKDAAGNYAFCTTYIQLNNQNDCFGMPIWTAQITADARTMPLFGGACIDSVFWNLTAPAAGLPNPSLFDGFSTGCVFDFANAPIANSYLLTPKKDINPTNGLSTFDLVLISNHIIGAQLFDSPYKWIAADINRSGTVSTADIVELRKIILGILPDFPTNDSWRFVASDYNFTTTNPAGEYFPESIALTQLFNSVQKNFVGMKIGDLNGNADPLHFSDEKADDRSPNALPRNEFGTGFQIAVQDRFFEKGETFEVLFSLEKNESEATAFQFSLEHDGLEIVEILAEKGLPTDHFGLFKSEKLLTASWIETDGQPVFSLKMRAEKAGRLADFLKISDRKTRSEGYSSDGQPRLLQLHFSNEKSEKGQLQLFPAEPNPFDESTRVRFFSNEKEVVATVFDAAGRLVFSKKMLAEGPVPNSFSGGETSFQLFKNDLPASGFYLLKIETPSGSATQKLILNR